MRKTMELVVCALVLCLWVLPLSAEPPLIAEPRASQDFVGVLYECDVLPSQATPVWDRVDVPVFESTMASIQDGKLVINTLAGGGAPSWVLPGVWGGEWGDNVTPGHNYTYFPPGQQNYPYPGEDNPWAPNARDTGYTIEWSIEVFETIEATQTYFPWCWTWCPWFGFSFYIGEGDIGNGKFDIDHYEDKIIGGGGRELTDGATAQMYTGDLTGGQHKVRLVRFPGDNDDPLNPPWIKLYVDGVLSYTGTRHIAYTYDNNIIVNAAWDGDWVFMGSTADRWRYHVAIDYVRMDFTGPYAPSDYEPQCGDLGYLITDFNKDCVVDITDLKTLAQGWLMCTDPTDASCIDCLDPVNAEYCL